MPSLAPSHAAARQPRHPPPVRPDGDFAPRPTRLETRWASCESDVRDAQRLRYQVFAEDMGARLRPDPGVMHGLDADRFDPFCDHLMVRAVEADHGRSTLVGTYRVMSPEAAHRAGGCYTDTEFDLSALASLRCRALEVGRSCVHPAWRTGAVIMALWSALGRHMLERGLDTMIGCASVPLDDQGATARSLWRALRRTHLVEPRWRVLPRVAFPIECGEETEPQGRTTTQGAPPLIKGYLRCGARLLGPPALDTDFNTADLPIMLRLGDVTPRYRDHFFGTCA